MSTKCAMICWFVLLLSVNVNSKICTRKTMVKIHEESFDGKHNRTTTIEPKYETKIEKYDCDVLKKSDDYHDTSTEFDTDPTNFDFSFSSYECDSQCNNGFCNLNVCECYMDYTLVDGICQPFCSEPCNNGTCVSPDYCECNPGYRISDDSICEPFCSSGCQNGLCVAPETCQCKPGYSKELIGLSYVCTPDCKGGYTKISGICSPKCKACDNGKCTAPDVCTCSHGYKMNFNKLINPDGDDAACIPSCIKCFGRCIAPNTCHYDVTAPHFEDVTFSGTITMDPTTEAQTTTPMSTKSNNTTVELRTTDVSDATSTTVKTTHPTTTLVKTIHPITTSDKTIYFSTTRAKPTDSTTTSAKLIDLITASVKTTYTTTTLVKTTHPPTVLVQRTNSTTYLDKRVTPSVASETNQAFPNAKAKHNCDQDAEKQTWVKRYGTFILWPILALAIVFIIILLVWRRKSVVYYFIGKNYVVNDNVAHDDCFARDVHYNKKDENVDCLKELI